jgi:hypothetical protein
MANADTDSALTLHSLHGRDQTATQYLERACRIGDFVPTACFDRNTPVYVTLTDSPCRFGEIDQPPATR